MVCKYNININNIFNSMNDNYNYFINKIGYKLNYLFIIWLCYPIINSFMSQINIGFHFKFALNFFNFPLGINLKFGQIKDRDNDNYNDNYHYKINDKLDVYDKDKDKINKK
jgi:hypothetical protein